MECGVTELQSQGQDKMEIVLAKDGKQLKKLMEIIDLRMQY